MSTNIFNQIESDLRILAQECRGSEGLTGQITGWISTSGNEKLLIKDATETALLHVRAAQTKSQPVSQLSQSKEVTHPYLLSLSTKNGKLVYLSLAALQRLIQNNAINEATAVYLAESLSQIVLLNDQPCKLKALQAALALLQCSLFVDSEDVTCLILSFCFSQCGNAKSSDSVLSTASATIRQAVVLTLDHVHMSNMASTASETSITTPRDTKTSRSVVSSADPLSPHTPQAQHSIRVHIVNKIIQDLCRMIDGLRPEWLDSPQMSKQFSMDLLDLLLSHKPALFRSVPGLERALRQTVCDIIVRHMRNALESEVDTSAAPNYQNEYKLLLRCIQSLLRNYYDVLPRTSNYLIACLTQGCRSTGPQWLRIWSLRAISQICCHQQLIAFIYSNSISSASQQQQQPSASADSSRRSQAPQSQQYDANSVQLIPTLLKQANEMVTMFAKSVTENNDEEALYTLASLYRLKASGLSFQDNELLQQSGHRTDVYLVMYNIECHVCIVDTIAQLVDTALDTSYVPPTQTPTHSGPILTPLTRRMCTYIINDVWQYILSCLSTLLSICTGEHIVLTVLRSYQYFTQCVGLLQLTEPRDAFLASLCDYTLAKLTNNDEMGRSASAQTVPSTGLQRGYTNLIEPDQKVVLSPKNVQAFRTLFNIAHRLDSALDQQAWVHIVETIDALDHVLSMAQTTTQEVSVSSTSDHHSSDLNILQAAATQLIGSTTRLGSDSVISLMMAIRDVSQRNLPQAMARSGSNARAPQCMCALVRLVDTVVANLDIINDTWSILLDHLSELLSDNKQHVRQAAIHALDRVCSQGIDALYSGRGGGEQAGRDAQPALSGVVEEGGHVEGAVVQSKRSADSFRHNGILQNLKSKQSSMDGESAAMLGDLYSPRDSGGAWVLEGPSGDGVAGGGTGKQKPRASGLQGAHGLQGGSSSVASSQHIAARRSGTISVANVEYLFLSTLQQFYCDYQDTEVRVGVLQIILKILQRHGDELTRGWQCVLTQLSLVVQGQDLATYTLAFQCIEQIVQQHIGALTMKQVETLLDIATGYIRQRVDVNISLTAISLLWTAVDGLLREQVTVDAASSGGSGGGEKEGDRAMYCQNVLLSVLNEFKDACTDSRPEVRNSIVRSFFEILQRHGGSVSDKVWLECVWHLAMPLVTRVQSSSIGANTQDQDTEVGKEHGVPVKLLVHHSRNTAAKQWEETVGLCLGGLGKLLRAHLPRLVDMDSFPEVWEATLQVAGDALLDSRRDVIVGGMSMFNTILPPYTANGQVGRAQLKQVLSVVDTAVHAMNSDTPSCCMQARAELVMSLGQLYVGTRQVWDSDDVALMLSWLDAFMRHPQLLSHGPTLPPVSLSLVQRAVFEVMQTLAPLPVLNAWPQLLNMLCLLLTPAPLYTHFHSTLFQTSATDRSAPDGSTQLGGRLSEQRASGSDFQLDNLQNIDIVDYAACIARDVHGQHVRAWRNSTLHMQDSGVGHDDGSILQWFGQKLHLWGGQQQQQQQSDTDGEGIGSGSECAGGEVGGVGSSGAGGSRLEQTISGSTIVPVGVEDKPVEYGGGFVQGLGEGGDEKSPGQLGRDQLYGLRQTNVATMPLVLLTVPEPLHKMFPITIVDSDETFSITYKSMAEVGARVDKFEALGGVPITHAVQERTIRVLVSLFIQYAPRDMQIVCMPNVLFALACACMHKKHAPACATWRLGAQAFNDTLAHCVQYWSTEHASVHHINRTLGVVTHAVRAYFAVAPSVESTSTDMCRNSWEGGADADRGGVRDDLVTECKVVQTISDIIGNQSIDITVRQRHDLLHIIGVGVFREALEYEVQNSQYRFSLACMDHLHTLCNTRQQIQASEDGYNVESIVASSALALWLKVRNLLLMQYVSTCSSSVMPSNSQADQVKHALQLMKCLYIDYNVLMLVLEQLPTAAQHKLPALVTLLARIAQGDDAELGNVAKHTGRPLDRVDSGEQQQAQILSSTIHLLFSYNELCQCANSQDPSVRAIVIRLLQAVGKDLGLS